MEFWLDDSRFALHCLSVLKLHEVMYCWLALKKKSVLFYGPLPYSWSGHVNLINRIYYDKYVHLNHKFYWNNVVMCFRSQRLKNFSGLSECALLPHSCDYKTKTVHISKKTDYLENWNYVYFYELVSWVVFTKVW